MIPNTFKLHGEIVIITGGAGLLGEKHGEAVAEIGGIPVILDIDENKIVKTVKSLRKRFKCNVEGYLADVADERKLLDTLARIKKQFRKVPYGLINNATIDAKFDIGSIKTPKMRLESFPLEEWKKEIDVGLTGTFLCAKVFGSEMAQKGKGVIINISSDLGIIAPDQRIYRKAGASEKNQAVKPVTYSVIKHGLIGLTKYLATYWADKGIRVNALCPGGVYNNQPEDFVRKLTGLIPMGRMANSDEYKAAIAFLISDASSYMTGSTLIMDGGRTCW